MGIGAIWGTKVLVSDETRMCVAEDADLRKIRIVLILNVILAYCYEIILATMWCCICMVLMSVCKQQSDQRRAALEE